jgi:ribosomal protein S18 acetylase RimI-like enzyme
MSEQKISVRVLQPSTMSEDWQLWKNLRLEATQLNPDAFDHTHEELLSFRDDYFKEVVDSNIVFGAFLDDELVGGLGLSQENTIKQKHRGHIFNVFLTPKCRGLGMGKLLFNSAIDFVNKEKKEIIQLQLSVGTVNSSAVGLYKSMGFVIYGTDERRLVSADGKGFIDEYLMVLKLVS